jgi:hypothetical protein
MKKILLSFFVLVYFNCDAQITFERTDKVLDQFSTCCPYSKRILETPDHGFLTSGFIYEGLISFYYWERIDSAGQYLSGDEFGFGFIDVTSMSASLTSDHGFIFSGNPTLPGGSPMGIVKADSTGTMEWYKIIGISGMDLLGNRVIQSKDGGYIVAGSKFGMGSQNAKLIKLDSTGNVVWSKVYYGSQFEGMLFTDIIQADDSGFMIVGKAYSVSIDEHVIIIRTDSQGDTLWTRQYANTVMTMEPTSISRTMDSCYVISGFESSVPFPGSFLFKINSSGDTLWKREFGYGDSLVINNVEQTNDSGFILSATQDYYKGLLIKTDGLGNILWTKEMNSNFRCEFAIQSSDGGYAIAGGPGCCVIKTDSLGNTQCTSIVSAVSSSMMGMDLVYSSINITTDTLIFPLTGFQNLVEIEDSMLCNSLSINKLITDELFLELSPNPAESFITVSSLSPITYIEIYNTLGDRLKTIDTNNQKEIEINLEDLIPGIYFLKIFSNEKVFIQKMIKY